MARLKIEYGIDLGTTNSAIARIESGIATILEIDNSKTVPSAVSYDRRDRERVGITAVAGDCYVEFKRDMGKTKLVGQPDAKKADGTPITPEFLSSKVLQKLSDRVNDEVFKSLVVTVPAMFESGQVAATKRAAEMAGFEQIEILMEPVAAATAFAMQNIGKNGNWLIFDFGGGTFDASILKVDEGIMKVLASDGDNRLGGGDLDRAIVNEIMIPEIEKENNLAGLDENQLKGIKRSLKLAADKIKIELSFKDEVDYGSALNQFGNDVDGNDIDLEYVFKKDDVHKLFLPYYQKAIDFVKPLIERAKLTINEIDELILVGGPTQIPLFRKMIEDQLMKPNTSVNPMTGIAEGAAIFASNIKNEIKNHGDKIGEDVLSDEEVHVEEIEIEYNASTALDVEPVTLMKKDKNKKLFAIIKRSDGGFETAKQELDDVFNLRVNDGLNNFKIEVFDEKSELVKCNIDEINLTKGFDNPETSLPYFMGIEIIDSKRKRKLFRSLAGLEVDRPLPAVGLSKPNGELRTMSDVRPGVSDDQILIKLYQAEKDANNSRSKLNKYSGVEFKITGENVPKLIPSNTIINITVNIDRSQTITFEAEFPELDILIDDLPTAVVAAEDVTSSDDIEDFLNEANKLILDLSSTFPIPDSLNNLKSERDSITKDWNDNKDSEQTYRNLQGLIVKLDKEFENLEWPKLEEDIRQSLNELEKLVDECSSKKLKGYEGDKSDLDSFKSNFEQVKTTKNQNLGQSLLDNINEKNYRITDRHAGKEQTISFIRSFNQNFSTISWKNISQARSDVDKGMQMISFGASESDLKNQLTKIFSQMQDPDADSSPGGIKG